MKYTFETKDPKEAKRLTKALDMAIVLFEFSNNAMREFKHKTEEPTADELMAKFFALMDEHNIWLEDLMD